jgi:hypothetical protein
MYDAGFDRKADTVLFLKNHDVLIEGTKTKEKEGNGIGKGFWGYEGKPYRENDLTDEAIYSKLAESAKAIIDAKIKGE